MAHLKDLEQKSIFIIREAYSRFKSIALLWSIGKDSTTLLWLVRKAFYGIVPFTVLHLDTTYKFPEMYDFRDKYAKEWDLNLRVEKNQEALKAGIGYSTHDSFTCCHELKTNALKHAVHKHRLDALLVGIRRDEHAIRDKERYFSPRDMDFKWNHIKSKKKEDGGDSSFISMQDVELGGWGIYQTDFGDSTGHVRVHPLLHWTELDIWQYIQKENIPVCSLYFAKNGRRYRSLGCMPITAPVESDADTVSAIIEELMKKAKSEERSGRKQDKESAENMRRLRSLGYM